MIIFMFRVINLFHRPKHTEKLKQFCNAWLDKTAEIVEKKPNHLSFCKVVALIDEFNLWESQIIIFYDKNYYSSFWSRNSIEQSWYPIDKDGLSFLQERNINSNLKEKGYIETVNEDEYSHKTKLWFYGEIM